MNQKGRKELYAKYRAQGLSYSEIARRTGVSRQSVHLSLNPRIPKPITKVTRIL